MRAAPADEKTPASGPRAIVPGGGARDDLALIRRGQQGDRRAVALLLERHEGFIRKTAFRWRGLGLEEADLVQEARVGFLEAIERFDMTRETSLLTYAYKWMRGAVAKSVGSPVTLVSFDEGDGEGGACLLDRLTAEESDGSHRDDRIDAASIRTIICRLRREKKLSSVEEEVLIAIFSAESETRASVAARLGMTREWLWKTEQRALRKLRATVVGSRAAR